MANNTTKLYATRSPNSTLYRSRTRCNANRFAIILIHFNWIDVSTVEVFPHGRLIPLTHSHTHIHSSNWQLRWSLTIVEPRGNENCTIYAHNSAITVSKGTHTHTLTRHIYCRNHYHLHRHLQFFQFPL